MACNHKFIDYLTLEGLDFEPTTLIVGTFNPAWPESNYSEWFYGRTANNYFWDILPRMFNQTGLRDQTHKEWKEFCKNHQIALTDLVSNIDDADPSNENHCKILGEYTDSALASKFKHQTPTQVIELLKKHPAIQNLYLTTTATNGLWYNLWAPVVAYCEENNLWCQQLMTPSKGARFFMTKGSGENMPEFIYRDWVSKWNCISIEK